MEENQTEGNDSVTIKIRKDQVWKYSTFVLAALIIVGAFVFFMNGDNGTVTGNTVNTGNNVPTQPSKVQVSVDDDALLGDKDAKVTIVEFSDYQCPFCRKFWTDTYPLIKAEYIDTGKANLVFRDFPLASLHPIAQKSAEAAECAREKGGDEGYYKMHDKMFSEQNILDSGNPTGAVTKTAVYTNDDLKKWAKDLGYDIGSCLDSGKFASEVQKDTADAQKAGGQGTPYFIVNGQPLSGAQPFAAFKQVIDAELNA